MYYIDKYNKNVNIVERSTEETEHFFFSILFFFPPVKRSRRSKLGEAKKKKKKRVQVNKLLHGHDTQKSVGGAAAEGYIPI